MLQKTVDIGVCAKAREHYGNRHRHFVCRFDAMNREYCAQTVEGNNGNTVRQTNDIFFQPIFLYICIILYVLQ